MIKDYVSGVVNACGEILHGASAKLVDAEDNIIYIGDPIYVVLKDIDAEGMDQVWKRAEIRRNQLKTKKAQLLGSCFVLF